MSLFEPVLLGIAQGITEWLPLSSEGISSIIMVSFFGKGLSEAIFLSIWLHAGTLIAALVYFREDIGKIISNLPAYKVKGMEGYNGLTSFLLVSTLATAIIGAPLLLLGLNMMEFSGNRAMAFIGLLLIFTGILQGFSRKAVSLKKRPGIRDAILVGVVQAFSVLPGLSRSGLTTSFLLLDRYEARDALRLSFLMSIPVILVAEIGIALLGKISFDLYSAVAVAFSFLFGLATIKALMKIAGKINFGWFCIFLGILAVLTLFI
ncbi:MAG: undecaprenyl-diphosphate phosphatase [archaeon]|nr:MAG: undecaprenyl-diphosphate phosphatase [archaeon]